MRKEILHQYANSPKLLSIIDKLADMLSTATDNKNFYDKVLNIKTAVGFGLDNWGAILDTPRSFTLTLDDDTRQVTLDDDTYRLILLLKCAKNISNGSCPDIFKAISAILGNSGDIYISEIKPMQLRYSFGFLIDSTLLAILEQLSVFPKPVGVGVEIYELPDYNIFGFNGQELSNFNNGTFFQGERILTNGK